MHCGDCKRTVLTCVCVRVHTHICVCVCHRVLALAEDMIGNSLNFNTNLRSFLLNFVGSGDTDNEQFGLIGNR